LKQFDYTACPYALRQTNGGYVSRHFVMFHPASRADDAEIQNCFFAVFFERFSRSSSASFSLRTSSSKWSL